MQATDSCRSLRILFVEDHADTAEVFGRALELEGYSVEVANDSRSAMALAARSRFDLLLCDIALSDGDGCKLLVALRKLADHPHLRAIAFTGLATADDINRIKAAGYDAHVLKPVELEDLAGMIEKVFADGRESHRPFIFSTPRSV